LLIFIPPMKQQSVTIVRAVVDSKLRKFHGTSPVASVAVRTVSRFAGLCALRAD
jgi:hypothetical protein